MADKQLLLKDEDLFLSDDDPLAELARIVGYDPQRDAPKATAAARREPEFDLENELLKEFELYEAPDVVAVPEPVIEPVAAAPAPQPVAVEEEATAIVAEPPRRPASHPVFDLEDEIMREFAIFDARRGSPAPKAEPVLLDPAPVEPLAAVELAQIVHAPQEEPLYEQAVDAPVDSEISASWYSEDATPVLEDEEPVAAEREEPLAVDEDYWADLIADDLANVHLEDLEPHATEAAPVIVEDVPAVEIETVPVAELIAAPAVEVAQEVQSSESVAAEPVDALLDAERELDLLLADPEPVSLSAAPSVVDTIPEVPLFPSVEPVASSAMDVAPAVEAVANVPEPSPEIRTPVAKPSIDADLDDLLADVARFPVSESPLREMPPKGRRSLATPVAPGAQKAEPVLSVDKVAPLAAPAAIAAAAVETPARIPEPEMKASFEAPAPRSVEPPVVAAEAPVAPMPVQKVPDVQSPVSQAQPVEHIEDNDIFDDANLDFDFGDLDFEDFELELSGAVSEVNSNASSRSAPSPVTASRDSLQALESAVVVPEPVREPVHAVAQEAIRRGDEGVADYSALPFDSTQIVGEEDELEVLADIDVPDVHVEVETPFEPDTNDYDLDVDAEMAQLFAATSNATGSVAAARNAKAPLRSGDGWDNTNAKGAPREAATLEFDEFEKALEEDFRRSLSENRLPEGDDIGVLPPSYEPELRPSSSRKPWLMATAAGVVLLLGAAGGYAWLSGSTSLSTTSGEPRVILADKEPVKVVPDNKGGKTVPNQDKAVYDRVSGATTNEPQQQNLVTSKEEPVDVVQKTLMPENMPMDEDVPGTETQDTSDPRLLPEETADNVSTANKALTGVSPRKVRTMVVKADGTLVPREEIEETAPLKTNEADAAAAEKGDRALKVDPAEEVKDRLPAADATVAAQPEAKPEETAAEQPVAKQPAVPADADVAALEKAADATVDEAPAVKSVKTVKVEEAAPLPETRPVEQPVNVVAKVTENGNVEQPAAVDQQAAATQENQPAATPLKPGTYVIQIASLPSEAEAQKSYAKLSSRFGSVIGGRGVDIKKAQIEGKGTYYRVRIPAGSKEEAQALCSRYKSAGGSCLVSR